MCQNNKQFSSTLRMRPIKNSSTFTLPTAAHEHGQQRFLNIKKKQQKTTEFRGSIKTFTPVLSKFRTQNKFGQLKKN